MKLDIVIVGLTITSSWGNGHATTYRGLAKALARRGHRVTFLERDVAWYRQHREELRQNPYLRNQDEILANALLPLLERAPSAGPPSPTSTATVRASREASRTTWKDGCARVRRTCADCRATR